MSIRVLVPTSVGLEARLVADPVLRYTREGRAFMQVRVEAELPPVREAGRS